jgi:hypothetical protein
MARRRYETCGKSFTSRRKAERYAKDIAKASGVRVPMYETTGFDAARTKLVTAMQYAR